MKNSPSLKEYANRLTDADIHFIYVEFHQGGDTGELVNFLSEWKEIDKWLASATSTEDFFHMMDQIQEAIEVEYKSRLSAGRLQISEVTEKNEH